MADHVRFALALGFLVLGAGVEFSYGGPWLLIFGSLAMAYCIALAGDDRQGIAFTVIGCTLWTLLHWSLGAVLTRIQASVEIAAFMTTIIAFWVVRLVGRDRFAAEMRRQQREGESVAGLSARLKRIRDESEGMARESEGWVRLFGVMRDIGEVIRIDEIVDVIHATMREHLRLPVYALFLARDGQLKLAAQRGFSEDVLGHATLPLGGENVASWLIQQRDPLLVDNMASDTRLPESHSPFKSLLALPMWSGDEALGVLLAFDPKGRTFAREDFARAGILSRQLALGIEKTLLYERVQQLSITDGLTRLHSHRYFQERLEGELERARRYQRPLSLILSDLDLFKEYNDSYGHLEGDEMLRHVSSLMEGGFKAPSVLSRYGGEEFAEMLPDHDKNQAAELAERFRKALESTPLPGAESRNVCTISIGVAAFPKDAQSRRDLIARADEALYRAKNEGRNKVCIYEQPAATDAVSA